MMQTRIELLMQGPLRLDEPDGWMHGLASHLWQSTLFVALAWLLTLALRKNRARIRYMIWLAASLKFLVPLSLLFAIGSGIGGTPIAPMARGIVARTPVASVVEQIYQPRFEVATITHTPAGNNWASNAVFALAAVWAIGALALLLRWTLAWRLLRRSLRDASEVSRESGVPICTSSAPTEPGVFGVFRPVLVLPEGILQRLSEAQLSAVISHEMCHIRRRDNFTFALHMVVETLFWFHPMVWWIRKQLIEERERACDEAVLQAGNAAEVYAESILNVCRFYVESPLACAAGVTGADLKRRIVRIMTVHSAMNLGLGRKLLIAGVTALVLSMPVVLGLVHAQEAQTNGADAHPEFEVATVKPAKAGDDRRSMMLSPGKFAMENMPVTELIRFAYDLKSDSQLSGGPDWLRTQHFDVEAKESEADVKEIEKQPIEHRADQVRLMIQALLAERFQLKVSESTKDLPVYALVVAKGGIKLTPVTPPAEEKPGDPPQPGKFRGRGIRTSGPGQLEGLNAPMDILAAVLSRQPELENRLVIDHTGLTGSYDWKLKWTSAMPMAAPGAGPAQSESSAATDSQGPSLFTAVQEQLGLKLEPQKAPVKVIVIDSVAAPSPN